jgi:hypothetical protein
MNDGRRWARDKGRRTKDEGRNLRLVPHRSPLGVELHIGELVLHGFAPGHPGRIGAAVEAELARLLAERGVAPSLARGGATADLDAGSFEVEPSSRADVVGQKVARAVYGGLSR